MATIRNFTELRCWQEAHLIAKDVYLLVRSGLFERDYGLKDQVQRAVVSIGSNIAEGFERGSNAELVKFLSYAKGSVGEVMSQLYTAFDVGYFTRRLGWYVVTVKKCRSNYCAVPIDGAELIRAWTYVQKR